MIALSEAQRALWHASSLDPRASSAFVDASVVHLNGAVDVKALAEAVRRVIARHDALRACVAGEGPKLPIAPLPGTPDLRVLSGDEDIASWLTDEIASGPDLEGAPHARFFLRPRTNGAITTTLVPSALVIRRSMICCAL